MRRSLILTVAAAVTMVLLAMLVPTAVLLRAHALEDRIARAALEVQATESAVSGSGDDKGSISVFLDRVNAGDSGIETTVLYPNGSHVGPDPGSEDEQVRVVGARNTGTARIDDVAGGAVILVPVSLGGGSALPENTPVVRVFVEQPGLASPDLLRAYLILGVLGLVLLVGALVLADRIGRSFVAPIRDLADYTGRLGSTRHPEPVSPSGPRGVRDLGASVNRLVDRIEVLLERERASIADVSHRLRTPMTALRLRVDGVGDAHERERLSADLDELQAMVDHVVREARRSEREGLVPGCVAGEVVGERVAFWAALAEDQQRRLDLDDTSGTATVAVSAEDLAALVDVLLDNVFSHTPDGAGVRLTLSPGEDGGARLVVEDDGPGLPAGFAVDRGTSGAGSTGLGLSIVDKTATESGGGLSWGASASGGARLVIDLGDR